MDNIEPLFGRAKNEDVSTEPNFSYTITLKDQSEPININGYLVVNSLFTAICRGDGVIYWLEPFENVKRVENNGPISTAKFN